MIRKETFLFYFFRFCLMYHYVFAEIQVLLRLLFLCILRLSV